MINRIIAGCLKNRFLVLAGFAAVIVAGVYSARLIPVDAIPDIGEMQITVYADWPGRSPKDIENQVIYPLTTGLMGTPGTKTVRSSSGFGFGMVNMIFQEGTDYYWARTRVLERLDYAKKDIPDGVAVTLGPDATALGQVFWYTVEGEGYSLQQLRSIQDWYVRYALTAVPGVAEVASAGGYVKQYQVDVDPRLLAAYHVSILDVADAVRKSNIDVGAKVFESGGVEYVVRGIGFIKSAGDIEEAVVASKDGVPVRVKDIGRVMIGADFRRGALDKGGREATGGVVVMRYGGNPRAVIAAVKKKIAEISPGLPAGVSIVPFYDRTGLIDRAIHTLQSALVQESLITAAVIFFFLLHFWGSLVIALVLPVGVFITFILMRGLHIDANIMSLGGIAIAIGVMVDSGCVLVENIYTRLSQARQAHPAVALTAEERLAVCTRAAQEVGRPVLFALLTTIVSFIPVFVLTGQAGKLFRPLAFTKTFAMSGAAFIALLLLPTVSYYLLRGRLRPVEKNRTTLGLYRLYRPFIRWALSHRKVVVVAAVALCLLGGLAATQIKQEFMPPLNEGDLLFMPVLMPGASLTQVQDVLRRQDMIIENDFPEVAMAVGKLGRAETATDPAPVLMIETLIRLKDKSDWRPGMTREKLVNEIIARTRMPGVSPIMTQPIRNRIDMLATGIQTPVGIKVFGPDFETIEQIAVQLETVVRRVPGAVAPYADRSSGRPYFEITVNRSQAARYGIPLQDIQSVISTAIGGMNITDTVEGRERYPVRVRYMRELRDDPDMIRRILVPTRYAGRMPGGQTQVPLAALADFKTVPGPAMILSENSVPYSRVFVNVDQSKTGLVDFVKEAQKTVDAAIKNGEVRLPAGYFISWSGQFESEIESRERLLPAVLGALAVVLLLLYIAFKKRYVLAILSVGLPLSLVGGLIMLYCFGFRFSTAVWVGFIALFGVATDNAVVLLTVLEELFETRRPGDKAQIRDIVIEGTLMRIRPAMMTVMTTIIALVPVMLATGSGSEIMRPMAAPTVGGLVTATLANFILVPVLYSWVKEREQRDLREDSLM